MGNDGPTGLRQMRAAMVPITFGVLIPMTIVWRSQDSKFFQDNKAGLSVLKIFGAIFWFIGASVLFASNVSFHKQGKGTLEPWARPKHLVTTGVYRHAELLDSGNPHFIYEGTIALPEGEHSCL